MEDLTKYFYGLTPERILDAVEESGVRCTGRCLALNSLENRVYEVEIEVEDEADIASRYERFRVVKFYRPGRWTREQILEEHEFIEDLNKQDIPAVAPLTFSDGSTLRTMPEVDIYYTVFPRVGGRTLDELKTGQIEMLGRLIARMHNVGASRSADHRIILNHETYGLQNLEYLLSEGIIPEDYRDRYETLVREISAFAGQLFQGQPLQRVHGDLHCGNIIWNEEELVFVDFDDMVKAPVVQDLWLIIPGRDEEAIKERQLLLHGYEQMREFDYSQLGFVEVLRALRIIHFCAWIARRREDPAFQRVFSDFGSLGYWRDQIVSLDEQLCHIHGREW